MPIYKYRCSSCSHELETLQRLADAPLVACPSCGSDTLVKQVTAAGFQLTGSGWYATDFKGGGKQAVKKEPDGETKSAGESKSGGDSKSGGESKSGGDSKSGGEAKPESKSDGAPKPESKPGDKSGTGAAGAAGSTPASS